MKEAGKKSRVIEVYSLIFIDLLCTGVAFGLSAFLRQVYDVNGPLDRRSSLLGCVLSPVSYTHLTLPTKLEV